MAITYSLIIKTLCDNEIYNIKLNNTTFNYHKMEVLSDSLKYLTDNSGNDMKEFVDKYKINIFITDENKLEPISADIYKSNIILYSDKLYPITLNDKKIFNIKEISEYYTYNLKKYKKVDLEKICNDLDIKYKKSMKKEELIEIINKYLKNNI